MGSMPLCCHTTLTSWSVVHATFPRTSHLSYDVDLVHDALKECVMKVSVTLTGFDDGPNEFRRLSTCAAY